LQNESAVLSTQAKVELIRRTTDAGVRRIETVSFVNPRLVPQMADAEAVMAALGDSPDGVSYIGLVLNRRGLDRALATAVDEVNLVVGATDGFTTANQGSTVADTMAEIEAMLPEAAGAGRSTTVTISVAFGCPFEGEVPVEQVSDLAGRAAAAGADEIALGDTIGVAVPAQVLAVVEAVVAVIAEADLRMHFHDTRNTGVANVYAALTAGVTIVDASVGGAGGCPFAPDATGNGAPEAVLHALNRLGASIGSDIEATIATGRWLGKQLGRELPAALGRAGDFPTG
jgi:hydroxymethylglutaryl-CoA lyase